MNEHTGKRYLRTGLDPEEYKTLLGMIREARGKYGDEMTERMARKIERGVQPLRLLM